MGETNKMASMPMGRLVFNMGVPMILSMVLQALYNIVDSYFVSCITDPALANAGDYAVNALTLAFPIQMLMVAIGVGTGVGANSLLSRTMGGGDREKSSRIAGNAVFLSCCTYIGFLLFGLFGVGPYLRSQTSDPIVLGMAFDYVRLCAMGYSKAPFRPEYVKIGFSSDAGSITVCEEGAGVDFDEELAKKILLEKEVTIDIDVAEGSACASAYGCDLTYDYVKINGDYRT